MKTIISTKQPTRKNDTAGKQLGRSRLFPAEDRLGAEKQRQHHEVREDQHEQRVDDGNVDLLDDSEDGCSETDAILVLLPKCRLWQNCWHNQEVDEVLRGFRRSLSVPTLAEHYNAEGRACIAGGLFGMRDMQGLIHVYYGIFLAKPMMRYIWSGTQAHKSLRDCRANGVLLAEAWLRVVVADATDAREIERKVSLIMSLCEATVRLRISVDHTGAMHW